MALYAMGDFHLAFQAGKPMDIFGDVWKNHPKKIEKNCRKLINKEDTLVITGDHSWGKNLSQCQMDLKFIENLPGRKILLRGNHDMFWDAKKTGRLNELYKDRLYFLQNNYYSYEDYALVGTKGYCYEGLDTYEHFLKIRDREVERLEKSFEEAKKDGYKKFIMFLHYPPTSIGEMESPFTQIAEKYGCRYVVYSHCHGKDRFFDSFQGMVNQVEYVLVSGDFLKFKPVKLI
ncbi:hypothetical protein SAMN05216249_1057 [Acetitomaculum ruminis DSM 5522]|uniref:Calcineurin-like phosphoesterase domain-containing protein n=1 Tax=Acetitomaculum ruminis DSM 5522 TaxID=1120918 RepID=A0A1I0WUH6_9FIRM|nr:metallophosphoesterase [Acetitomaculum ruminis]SFA92419.1 hypothetical protein SAMN05216249_1057 [Acetitomaculum ruminis DSM 5522]